MAYSPTSPTISKCRTLFALLLVVATFSNIGLATAARRLQGEQMAGDAITLGVDDAGDAVSKGMDAAGDAMTEGMDAADDAMAGGMDGMEDMDAAGDAMDSGDGAGGDGNTIADRLLVDGMSTLLEAVKAADLADTLSKDEYTVFAPLNEAFETLGKSLDELTSDIPALTNILTFHVVPGKVTSDMLTDGQEITTVQGGKLIAKAAEEGGPVTMITTADGSIEATITEADIEASNGVIHAIGTVLLPPSDDAEGGDAEGAEPEEGAEAEEVVVEEGAEPEAEADSEGN